MNEMPPSDQSPRTSPPARPRWRGLLLPYRLSARFCRCPLFAGRIGSTITKVGTYQTVAGFREAVQLYMVQGWYVGTTRQAVAGMIAQAVRRQKAAA